MRFVDVNVLVSAHRPESPDHAGFRSWLDEARTADEPLGLGDLVLSGFLRVVTHPRVFKTPTPLDVAVEFVAALRSTPNVVRMLPGDRHFNIFLRLCRDIGARGNDVPDLYLAALAIETGSTLWSADRSFARVPDLHWRHPLDGS